MPIKFKISAPGRIYMCGEHMVMYGKHALSTSLNLRSTVEFCEIVNSTIRINFPAIDLLLDVPVQLINKFISSENYRYLVDDNILFLRHVQYFITVNGMWKTYDQRFSLQTFFFLFLFISYHEKIEITAFNMLLTTQLPVGKGLGSSSSFAVCLAACFLHWGRLQKGRHEGFTNQELDMISEWAMFSEEVIQNYVFETDHDVCTHGHMTLFRYKELVDSPIRFLHMSEMSILLIDSKFYNDKQEQMKKLAVMKRTHRNGVNVILNKIDNVSREVYITLSKIKASQRSNNVQLVQELYKTLQNNITLNQDMLKNLNLSHPNLERIFDIATRYGFAGKLTGFVSAYAYILLPPNTLKEHFDTLCDQLHIEGFYPIVSNINSRGVTIEN
ncbi:mevalonate kinase-like [Nylanderia fulva]|uniref:mevalonate kinase-like n=1 Tax=Nylanderia fulva TaxID=613905 RepID=UPI0010FAEE5D|nr:mevalonate kinase-like [Nylanderia fulva]